MFLETSEYRPLIRCDDYVVAICVIVVTIIVCNLIDCWFSLLVLFDIRRQSMHDMLSFGFDRIRHDMLNVAFRI